MVSFLRALVPSAVHNLAVQASDSQHAQMEYFESDTDDATDSEHVASEASDEGGLPSGDDEASDDASDSGNETSEDVMSE